MSIFGSEVRNIDYSPAVNVEEAAGYDDGVHSAQIAQIEGLQNHLALFEGGIKTDIQAAYMVSEGVGEEEVLHRCYEIVVGIDEDEFIILFPVNEDTVLTWRPQVAGGLVFPPQARCEDGVLKHIGERIGLSGDTVAESAVNLPHVDAFGNLLVGTQRVGRLLPVLGIGDIAVGVYLVEPVVVIVNLRMR